MKSSVELRAAQKFGPGYFIHEQMDERSWTQEDVAQVLGVTVKHVNKILQDKQPLTLEMARILGEVFNTSPQYWVNLDTGFRLWREKERSPKERDADIKALIYERMPVRDMLKKGWLKPWKNAAELSKQVLRFWGIDSLDFDWMDNDVLQPYFARRSATYNQFNASYAFTWYRRAVQVAGSFRVPTFREKALDECMERMHELTNVNDGVKKFIDSLNKAGVIFFVLPHLQNTYLDGAAFKVKNTPVVVYTGRYRRIDNFWFTVAHEIGHVLKHLNPDTPFILDDLKNGDSTLSKEQENEANEYAAQKLKHAEILEMLSPPGRYLTHQKVMECAAKLRIHPAIVVGKLAHDDPAYYKRLHLHNETVLDQIPARYLVK
jgi:HTH-type transcriptional regulator/antitoxin HigA